VKAAGSTLSQGESTVLQKQGDNSILVHAIFDSKVFYLLDTFCDPFRKMDILRKQVGSPDGRIISAPLAMYKYNKNMGGSDGFDQKRAAYSTHQHRSAKFWHSVMKFGLDIAASNCFVVLDQLNNINAVPKTDRRQQLVRLGMQLCGYSEHGQSIQNVLSSRQVRLELDSPWKHHTRGSEGRGRCAHCASDNEKTKRKCVACDVFMHDDCFEEYHDKNFKF
jgi:hypothetical protein